MLRGLVSALLASIFLLHSLNVAVLPPLTALDRVAYDYLISTNPQTHNAVERVVILDIDEKSLSNSNLGRWPWSRDVMSDVVALLFQEYKVRVLGFDVVFSEPDTSSGLRALDALAAGPLANNPAYIESLKKIRPQLEYDSIFGD